MWFTSPAPSQIGVDPLSVGVEKNFADRSDWGTTYTPAGAPGRYWDDYCNWDRIDEYRAFVFESDAAELMADILRSDRIRFFHEHVLIKEPGTRETTPWHHDQPYYPVDGMQVASIWLPLDPVPTEAAVEFLAGSHLWDQLFFPAAVR